VVRAGLPAIHGATLASCFADYHVDHAARQSVDALLLMLTDPDYRYSISCAEMRPGRGQGSILAGNLSIFTGLLGTAWDLNYDGKLLVLEEVGEAPYKVHRMLTQLKMAGKFAHLAGLVFGRFARCTAPHGPTVEEVIKSFVGDILAGSTFPVAAGFPFGHWGENQPVPLGCRGELKDGVFALLESPLCR